MFLNTSRTREVVATFTESRGGIRCSRPLRQMRVTLILGPTYGMWVP
jgi:hypothetical protein